MGAHRTCISVTGDCLGLAKLFGWAQVGTQPQPSPPSWCQTGLRQTVCPPAPFKAPPREAAGTGHLCSVQPANSADSGMQSPRKQGLWHVLAPAGQCFPDPSAQQTAKPSLGLNTCPTTGATAGQGAARQDRFLPLFCPGLIDWLMLGKTRMPMEKHQRRGKGEQTPAGAAAAAVAEMS